MRELSLMRPPLSELLAEAATWIAALDLILPVPPSLNTYYRKWRNRLVISEAGRQYRGKVFQVVIPHLERNGLRWVPRFAEGDVAIEIAWYRAWKRGDVDNTLKATLDSLQKLAYTNDSQVASLHIHRFDKPFDGEPRLEVQVRAYASHA